MRKISPSSSTVSSLILMTPLQWQWNKQKLNSILGTVFLFYNYLKWKKKKNQNKTTKTNKQTKKWKPISFWCVIQNSVFEPIFHYCPSAFRRAYPTSRCCHVQWTYSAESSNITPKRQDAKDNRFPWIARNSVPRKELNN